MKFSILASGSEGNCAFVEDDNGAGVLIDVGLSMRRIGERLKEFDRDYNCIQAMLISHEHSDHLRGAAVIARRQDLPIYASEGTIATVKRHINNFTRFFSLNSETLEFGNLQVESFSVNHDASETMGFLIVEGDKRLVIATDLGIVDLATLNWMRDCDAIVLEANHDVSMLLDGPYPWDLKQRIKGQHGHLSNEQAGEALAQIASPRLKRVVLAHLSQQNNDAKVALKSVKSHLKKAGHNHIDVIVAQQHCATEMFEV
ncbi:MBL fold metallo-hydrolase [candidate division LCP-89 bacterium B3_LCP]|uniref:MBL fold metallo-hydrolase n=1 Tax=candidate division LCP-89 bacterium B3_LCP TaxID=2012998 RepID=A0A532V5K6_UNCL8|nr:MAG: MBL fold metallo-hydrolase [candidate division LCP-89 bacterium B3_LCP]